MKPHQKVWIDNTGEKPDFGRGKMVIHHKDGNHNNNDFSNLQLMTQSEHLKLHIKQGDQKNNSEEARNKRSISMQGNTNMNNWERTEEYRNKFIGNKNCPIGNDNASGKRTSEQIETNRKAQKELWIKIKALGFKTRTEYSNHLIAISSGFANYQEHLKDYLEDRKMVEGQIEGMKE